MHGGPGFVGLDRPGVGLNSAAGYECFLVEFANHGVWDGLCFDGQWIHFDAIAFCCAGVAINAIVVAGTMVGGASGQGWADQGDQKQD